MIFTTDISIAGYAYLVLYELVLTFLLIGWRWCCDGQCKMLNGFPFLLPPSLHLFVCTMLRLHLTICRKGVCLELSTAWLLLANGNTSRRKKKTPKGNVFFGVKRLVDVEEMVCRLSVVNLVRDLLGVWPRAILAIMLILCEYICLRGLTKCINRCSLKKHKVLHKIVMVCGIRERKTALPFTRGFSSRIVKKGNIEMCDVSERTNQVRL